jgi:hypothetical protein
LAVLPAVVVTVNVGIGIPPVPNGNSGHQQSPVNFPLFLTPGKFGKFGKFEKLYARLAYVPPAGRTNGASGSNGVIASVSPALRMSRHSPAASRQSSPLPMKASS